MKKITYIHRSLVFKNIASTLLGAALLFFGSKNNVIIITVLGFVLITIGLAATLIAYLFKASLDDNCIYLNFPIFLHEIIELKDIINCKKIIHYSNYEVARIVLIIYTHKKKHSFFGIKIDNIEIEHWLLNNGIQPEIISPSIRPGSGCDLPKVECEALCYRLDLGKRIIQPSCFVIVPLIVISCLDNNRFGEIITLITTSYWYFLMLYFHDLLFAAGNRIVGRSLPIGNIWSKLCIKKDYKFIILVAVSNLLIWITIILRFFTSVLIVYNDEWILSLIFLIPVCWMRMYEADDASRALLICLISAFISISYIPCLELGCSQTYQTSGIVNVDQNEEYYLCFTDKKNEYSIKAPALFKYSGQTPGKASVIIYKTALGGMYARVIKE